MNKERAGCFSGIYLSIMLNTIVEVINMNKANQEKINQKKAKEKFNSITQMVKPENQNQTHNIRSEAVEPKNRQI